MAQEQQEQKKQKKKSKGRVSRPVKILMPITAVLLVTSIVANYYANYFDYILDQYIGSASITITAAEGTEDWAIATTRPLTTCSRRATAKRLRTTGTTAGKRKRRSRSAPPRMRTARFPRKRSRPAQPSCRVSTTSATPGAVHNILYTKVNSNAMNGIAPGSIVTTSLAPWQIMVYALIGVCAVAFVIVWGLFLYQMFFRKKKVEVVETE